MLQTIFYYYLLKPVTNAYVEQLLQIKERVVLATSPTKVPMMILCHFHAVLVKH